MDTRGELAMCSRAAGLLALVLLAGFAAACGDAEQATSLPPTDRATATSEPTPEESVSPTPPSSQLDILEAVFQYQFGHNLSSLQQNASVYFLALATDSQFRDPDPELVARFEGHDPPAKPVSASVISEPGLEAMDKETGERGLIFWVRSVDWINNTEAEVDGGYYEGGLGGSHNIYRVVRQGENWIVTEDRIISIS